MNLVEPETAANNSGKKKKNNNLFIPQMPFNTYRNEFENTLEISGQKKNLDDMRTSESARLEKQKFGTKVSQFETQRI